MGAHCDDIEIGCAATVLHLIERFPEAHFDWVVFSSTPERAQEPCGAPIYCLPAPAQTVTIENFRNGFPLYWGSDQDYIELLKTRTKPDWIFTHHS